MSIGFLLLGFALAAIFNPVIAVTGIVLGCTLSHWSQCFLALLFAPVAQSLFAAVYWDMELPLLAIAAAPAGLIWTSLSYAAKRALASGDSL